MLSKIPTFSLITAINPRLFKCLFELELHYHITEDNLEKTECLDVKLMFNSAVIVFLWFHNCTLILCNESFFLLKNEIYYLVVMVLMKFITEKL